MDPQSTRRGIILKRLLIAGGFILLGICIYIVVSAVIAARSTGLLHISSSNPKATLSISQANHQATVLGVGTATIHLRPGTYQVSASYGGYQTNSSVQVYKGRETNSYLDLKAKPILSSVSNIYFPNIDTLINNGLTVAQINALKQEFFQYKQTAQKVSIAPTSVKPGPHNPNVDTSFAINFGVTVDSVSLNATIRYSDLTSVRLYLYSPQDNALVFDSATSGTSVE